MNKNCLRSHQKNIILQFQSDSREKGYIFIANSTFGPWVVRLPYSQVRSSNSTLIESRHPEGHLVGQLLWPFICILPRLHWVRTVASPLEFSCKRYEFESMPRISITYVDMIKIWKLGKCPIHIIVVCAPTNQDSGTAFRFRKFIQVKSPH